MNIFIMICIFTIWMSACDGTDNSSEEWEHKNDEAKETSSAISPIIEVDLKNKDGERTGFAELSETEEGVNIYIEAWDLPPGEHGFHIHEKGICEEPSFESAGEHFNPTHKKHGFDHPDGPHAGDLPNLKVAKDGTVAETFMAPKVTLKRAKDHSLLQEEGTALVIHEDPDDYISQPAGDAGERIACGVIRDHEGKDE